MSLVVGDQVEGHENNIDENVDNDVYEAGLNFKLAFIPGEKDDLLVQVTYEGKDGPVNVVRRLAGEAAEGETYGSIAPEKDGSYVIKGLQLGENEDFKFDIRLEGTQYLEQGVYIYNAVGGIDASQTFVGVAEGERNVDVSMGMTIKFDVDENDRVVATRKWSKDSRNSYSGGGNDPKDPPKPPTEEPPTDIPDEEPPLSDIPDEEPPLSGTPDEEEGMVLGAEDVAEEDPMVLGAEEELIAATGDNNHAAAGFGGMLAALAGMFMLRKKREN